MRNIFTILLILFINSICLLKAQDTIKVEAGWNMIGAKSTMLHSGFTSTPAGIITSQYYGYKSGVGYSPVDTLHDGKGFWVKATQAGILITPLFNQSPNVPYNPIPNNTTTDISTSPILAWSCNDPNNDPLTYDVYFGIDNPPLTMISSGQSDAHISKSGLSNSTLYYWRVVARDIHNDSISGDVWEFTTSASSVCGCGEAVVYEGRAYNTVKVGTQCWFMQNLNVGTLVNGSMNQSNNSTIEKHCYNNDSANCLEFGGLYQWEEAMDYSTIPGTQGICPTDWHIPTYTELQTLRTTVGNDGNAIKAVGQGEGGGSGTNTIGFSALFSGRSSSGVFFNVGQYTSYWSSTEHNASIAYYLHLYYDDSHIYFYYDRKDYGFSVRCLKD